MTRQLLKVVELPSIVDDPSDREAGDVLATIWQDAWAEIANSVKSFDGNPDFSQAPLTFITRHLHELHCGFVAVTYPFRDEDYLFDWVSRVGRAFRKHDRDCVRLHFFSRSSGVRETKRQAEIMKAVHEVQLEPFEGSGRPKYLGFMVLRPTGTACIGRTILASPHYYAPDQHIHVRATYYSNFLGSRLPVAGCPFMQQDGIGHVCAGVALWSMCYDLHRRYHSPRLFPSQITEIATSFDPRAEYDWGLSPRQMSQVLRAVGCGNDMQTAHLQRAHDDREDLFRDTIDNLYGYVQSNIPVLLSVWGPDSKDQDGHTVLVVGHDLEKEPVYTKSTAAKSGTDPAVFGAGRWNSEFVSAFYCQDDTRGPYSRMDVWSADREWEPKKKRGRKTSAQSKTGSGPIVLQHASRIVIQPAITARTAMTYRHARRLVEAYFGSSSKWIDSQVAPYEGVGGKGDSGRHAGGAGVSVKNSHQGTIELLKELKRHLEEAWTSYRRRLYLQRSTTFRRQLMDRETGRRGIGDEAREALTCLPLPRYVYVCDFCRACDGSNGELELLGEIVLDATEPIYTSLKAVVAVRMKELLVFQLGGTTHALRHRDYDQDGPNLAPKSSVYAD